MCVDHFQHFCWYHHNVVMSLEVCKLWWASSMLGVQRKELSEALRPRAVTFFGFVAKWGCPQNCTWKNILLIWKLMEIEHDVTHLPSLEVPKIFKAP